MGKSDDCALDSLKKRKMRNIRKKRRRQERAILKRARVGKYSKKIAESIRKKKLLTEKYCTKWRKAAKEARHLKERLDATKRQPFSKHVRWPNCTFVHLPIWSVLLPYTIITAIGIAAINAYRHTRISNWRLYRVIYKQ